LKGKILIRKSEFDVWLEEYRVNRKQDLNNVVDEVLTSLIHRRFIDVKLEGRRWGAKKEAYLEKSA